MTRLSFLAAALLTVAVPAAAQRAGDLGRFVATRVAISPTLDAVQRRYYADDPRFVDRLVEIAPQRLAIDGATTCTQPRRLLKSGPIAGLMREEPAPGW